MPVNILFNMSIRETPLKLLGSLIEPDLCMGQRILRDQFSGYSLKVKILLNKGRRIVDMPLVVFIIISATKPSGPPDLPSFKLFMLFCSSDMVNSSLNISLNAPSSLYSSILSVRIVYIWDT